MLTCLYCGVTLYALDLQIRESARGIACIDHRDLPALDPYLGELLRVLPLEERIARSHGLMLDDVVSLAKWLRGRTLSERMELAEWAEAA